MICKYGFKVKGASHEKEGTPCQDAFVIVPCDDDMVIAAVADGLGSCAYSEIGSEKVVKAATRYCKQNLVQSDSPDDILKTIKSAFFEAESEVEKEAESNNHDLVQYHTTLSLAVLIGDTLYYGHSGDSGIIALTTEGRFEKVTKQQRDEDGYVFPLFFNDDRWDFGQFDKKVCSVLLATDGMLECLLPRLLKNEPHVSTVGKLMDNRSLHIDKERENTVKEQMESYIKTIPSERVGHDDVTIVVLVNTSIEPRTQPMEYYKEPDWTELIRKDKEESDRALYPYRFEGESKEPDTDVDLVNAPEYEETVVPDDELTDITTDNEIPAEQSKDDTEKVSENEEAVLSDGGVNDRFTGSVTATETLENLESTQKKTRAKKAAVKKNAQDSKEGH